jgi:hypothetical protein
VVSTVDRWRAGAYRSRRPSARSRCALPIVLARRDGEWPHPRVYASSDKEVRGADANYALARAALCLATSSPMPTEKARGCIAFGSKFLFERRPPLGRVSACAFAAARLRSPAQWRPGSPRRRSSTPLHVCALRYAARTATALAGARLSHRWLPRPSRGAATRLLKPTPWTGDASERGTKNAAD